MSFPPFLEISGKGEAEESGTVEAAQTQKGPSDRHSPSERQGVLRVHPQYQKSPSVTTGFF